MKSTITSLAASRLLAVLAIAQPPGVFTIRALAVSLLALACPLVNRAAMTNDQSLTCAEMEEFLHLGRIGAQKNIPKGVTLPLRATLEYKGMKHDAAIQTIDVSKASYQTTYATELNFRDSWKYNVAGYELAKILELNMVPPYVERSVSGHAASLSWWANDAMMELDRKQHKLAVQDLEAWNRQMYAVRVWHELIYDTDPNLTNLLVTKDWQLWIIDFTRAFRLYKELRDPKDLVQCDRKLLANLRTVDRNILRDKLSRWLTKAEIDGLVTRARIIVSFFDKEVTAKSEREVLYDFPRSQQACGVGL
jgi:hypothetical protein